MHSYGYRFCVGDMAECKAGMVVSLDAARKSFSKSGLTPCTTYTACFSLSMLRELQISVLEERYGASWRAQMGGMEMVVKGGELGERQEFR